MKLSALAPVFLLSLGTLTACGGSDSTEPTPTPKDTTAPVITLIGNTPLTHSIDTSYDDEGATANDATDGNVDVTMTGSVDSTIVNSYTLTYTATDTAGNKSTSTRIVNVIDDVAPVITLGGSSEVIHPVGTAYIDASATASDNVDEAIDIITSDDVNADELGSYTVTYTAKDEAGNEATAVVRTVTVADLTAPVITLNGDAEINHEYGIAYIDAGATATDNIDGDVEAITTDRILIDDSVRSYGITYTATDAAGNVATLERIVNVVDTVGPVITLNGGDTITIGQDRRYKELGATAVDLRDNEVMDISAPSEDTAEITTTIGPQKLTYTATDAAGNISTLVRTIDVVEPRPFITKWKTDNVGGSDDFTINIGTDLSTHAGAYNYTVDWGDGQTDVDVTGDIPHSYTEKGTYTVTINGDFPQIFFSDNDPNDGPKLLSVEQWGDIEWLSMYQSFLDCKNFVINASDAPLLYKATNMAAMFQEAHTFNQSINHWDVSSITDMSFTFTNTKAFNQDLNNWDVSKVTTMNGILAADGYDGVFNGNVSSWDVSSVTDMYGAFYGQKNFNQDISAWDVSSVTTMEFMFYDNVVFDQNLSQWDIGLVTNMISMFEGNTGQVILSTTNYDALLIGWSQQAVKNGVTFHGGSSIYSASSQAAKDILIGKGWVITDGVTP